MCTNECKCYQGDNGENKDMWTGYGDEVLVPFQRNAGDREEFVDPDKGDFRITKPFIWTKDKEKAVKSFKDCYETVLKPKNLYISKEKEMVKKFYEEGGYDFLIWIETIHHNCASICDAPLFYITRDISEGMPADECVHEQIGESVELSTSVQMNCLIAAIILFQSSLWAIPLFAPLEANKGKKLCGNKKAE